jgi:hypothetical protein
MSATMRAKPAGIGAGAGARVATKYNLKQDGGEDSHADHRAAPLEKLTRTVIGRAGVFFCGGGRAGRH